VGHESAARWISPKAPLKAQMLIEAGSDVTLVALNGRTPLDLAIETYGEGHTIVALIRSKLAAASK
jgi:hypothetical protein